MTRVVNIFLVLSLMVVFMLIAASSYSADILLQTGFEDDTVGEMPANPADAWASSGGGFEVADSPTKEGGKSLGLIGGAGDNELAVKLLETQETVVTAEFWIYIEGVGRSITFLMRDPAAALADWGAAGPYVNWIAEGARYYKDAWVEIAPMSSGAWHYVRVVADTGNSVYDIYIADTVSEAHSSDPAATGLPYRAPITPARVGFSVYGVEAPAYIDNLLVYEGGVLPSGVLAVEPEGKLTSTWAEVRDR